MCNLFLKKTWEYYKYPYKWNFISVNCNAHYKSWKTYQYSNGTSHALIASEHTHTNFDWALYDSNIFELLKFDPNLMYYAKKLNSLSKFLY
jgi:hypothetical protein